MTAAVVAAALLVSSLRSDKIDTFMHLPSWMPYSVDAEHTFGAGDLRERRISDQTLAAVESVFEAYHERVFYASESRSNDWDRATYGPRATDMQQMWFTNVMGTGSCFVYSTWSGRYARATPDSRRLLEFDNAFALAPYIPGLFARRSGEPWLDRGDTWGHRRDIAFGTSWDSRIQAVPAGAGWTGPDGDPPLDLANSCVPLCYCATDSVFNVASDMSEDGYLWEFLKKFDSKVNALYRIEGGPFPSYPVSTNGWLAAWHNSRGWTNSVAYRTSVPGIITNRYPAAGPERGLYNFTRRLVPDDIGKSVVTNVEAVRLGTQTCFLDPMDEIAYPVAHKSRYDPLTVAGSYEIVPSGGGYWPQRRGVFHYSAGPGTRVRDLAGGLMLVFGQSYIPSSGTGYLEIGVAGTYPQVSLDFSRDSYGRPQRLLTSVKASGDTDTLYYDWVGNEPRCPGADASVSTYHEFVPIECPEGTAYVTLAGTRLDEGASVGYVSAFETTYSGGLYLDRDAQGNVYLDYVVDDRGGAHWEVDGSWLWPGYWPQDVEIEFWRTVTNVVTNATSSVLATETRALAMLDRTYEIPEYVRPVKVPMTEGARDETIHMSAQCRIEGSRSVIVDFNGGPYGYIRDGPVYLADLIRGSAGNSSYSSSNSYSEVAFPDVVTRRMYGDELSGVSAGLSFNMPGISRPEEGTYYVWELKEMFRDRRVGDYGYDFKAGDVLELQSVAFYLDDTGFVLVPQLIIYNRNTRESFILNDSFAGVGIEEYYPTEPVIVGVSGYAKFSRKAVVHVGGIPGRSSFDQMYPHYGPGPYGYARGVVYRSNVVVAETVLRFLANDDAFFPSVHWEGDETIALPGVSTAQDLALRPFTWDSWHRVQVCPSSTALGAGLAFRLRDEVARGLTEKVDEAFADIVGKGYRDPDKLIPVSGSMLDWAGGEGEGIELFEIGFEGEAPPLTTNVLMTVLGPYPPDDDTGQAGIDISVDNLSDDVALGSPAVGMTANMTPGRPPELKASLRPPVAVDGRASPMVVTEWKWKALTDK